MEPVAESIETSHSRSVVGLIDDSAQALRKARKNRHSLAGGAYYSKLYWESIGLLQRECEHAVLILESHGFSDLAETLRSAAEQLSNRGTGFVTADESLRNLRTIWRSKVQPRLGSESSRTAPNGHYLAPELHRQLPGYLLPLSQQLQGCHVSGYWDATLVLLRKIAESLLIEGYERSGKASEVKLAGEYIPLAVLIGKVKGGQVFRISRDSKTALDDVKKLGDNAAHNPRFNAGKSDVDRLRSGARVLVEDLIRNIEGFHVSS